MLEDLSSSVANALTLTLLHFLWQGLLVAIIYWTLLPAIAIRTNRLRYALSLLAISVMALCPLATFTVVYDSAVPQNEIAGLVATTRPSLQADSPAHSRITRLADSQESGSVEATETSPDRDVTGNRPTFTFFQQTLDASQPFVLLVWMTGVLFSGVRLMAGLGNVVWLRWGRMEIASELVHRSQTIARRLGVTSARVFSSTHIREAAVVGFLRPMVLLPASWLTAFPTNVLEAVIAHELAHIRRYDVWVNLLQRTVETLLFYHPAVWWLSNRIRLEREMCCDVLAAEITGDRGDYAIALEQIGKLQVRGTLHLSPAFMGDRKMNMLNRVQNVLGLNVKAEREPAWVVGLIAIAIPLLLAGIGGVQGQNVATAQDREASPATETGSQRSTAATATPRRGDDTTAEPASVATSPGRYQIQTTDAGVVLLDTRTGDSWSLSKRDGTTVWLPIPRGNEQSKSVEPEDRKSVVTDDGGTIDFRGDTPIRMTLGRRFDAAVIKRISDLTSLEEIDARHCVPMRDVDLMHFADLTNLRKLKLPAGIGDAGVRHLSGLTELTQLLFQDAAITATGMQHLKLMTKLEELGFWRCTSLTDEGFDHVTKMTSLKRLDLRRCAKLTDGTLQRISHLHSLELIDFGNVPSITDAGLKTISELVKLKYLGTVNTSITDFTPVRNFVKLELINVPPKFDDDQLRHLKDLSKLTNIGLDGTRVTDEGMAFIGSMQQVRWLAIRDTAVSDAGLASLKELPLLSYLHLEGTNVTDNEIADLKTVLPNCVVTGPSRNKTLDRFTLSILD